MSNSNIDSIINEKTEETGFNQANRAPFVKEDMDAEMATNACGQTTATENGKSAATREENIAEGVEGDTHSETRLGGPEIIETPESMVREWESGHPGIKLPKKARKLALLAASKHIHEGRGITVGDLEYLGLKKDNAEMKLYLSKKNSLLVPHQTLKSGKQKQYFLPNYLNRINTRHSRKERNMLPDDDLIFQLIGTLSSRKYTYHHIHLKTRLNYQDDYKAISWPVPSGFNQQKVKTFNLEAMRKCTVTVSTTGTVNITFECTLHPYEFHNPRDLIAFLGSCGIVMGVMQGAANNRLNVVPPIPDWYLTQFDYNKDIPSSRDPTVLSWSPVNGLVKMEYLGSVFQIYPKGIPEIGICTRVEGQYSTKKEQRLGDMIGDIVDGASGGGQQSKLPFVTAEEMLSEIRKKRNESDLG